MDRITTALFGLAALISIGHIAEVPFNQSLPAAVLAVSVSYLAMNFIYPKE